MGDVYLGNWEIDSFYISETQWHKIVDLCQVTIPWLIMFIVNPLQPTDAIWQHRSGSTLARVMAWCLRAPSHYMNHFFFTISEIHWHSSEGNFTRDTSTLNHWNYPENYLSKFEFKSTRGQWVNTYFTQQRWWGMGCHLSCEILKMLQIYTGVNLWTEVLCL